MSNELAAVSQFNREEVELIKTTVAKETTDAQLRLFLHVAARKRLDPLARQIHCVLRKNRDGGKDMVIQTGIDGYRLIAQRTGKYKGQLGPLWCGPDGNWRDVWLSPDPPAAAKVGVLHADFSEPLWAVARFAGYAQRFGDGGLMGLWKNIPDVMIAKCAEGLALRKAFPEELSDLYTDDEMAQADNPPVTVTVESSNGTRTEQVREKLVARMDAQESQAAEDAPPAEEPKQSKEMRRLHALLRERGFGERERGLDLITTVVGRHIASSLDLTPGEITRVVNHLADLPVVEPAAKAS